MKTTIRRVGAVATGVFAALTMGATQAAVVLANNPAPGDAYTGVSGSPGTGQAVGASGWYYNNVRSGGTIGIDTTQARSGNGSVNFNGPAGSKADIEYLAGGVAVAGNFYATASLGTFASFGGMSYDWYRNSASGAAAHLHPSLRILLDLDGNLATFNDRGALIFERAYNPAVSPVPVDAWNSDVINSTTKLWNSGLGLGNEFDIDNDGTPYDTLAEWQAAGRMANAVIVGFSSGIGSGWSGSYLGAVDNISWTINGQNTSTNFEVGGNLAVPEPATLALVGVSLLGLALTRRRQRG